MAKIKNIMGSLSMAAVSLVSSNAMASDVNADKDWSFKGAILGYNETDGVQVMEAIASAKKQIDTDESFSLKLTYDALTGSSPNGAIKSQNEQILTSPSGTAFTVKSGEQVDVKGFRDTRVAVNGGWQKYISRNLNMTLGGNISSEFDYQSIGVNSTFALDLNNKNTTLSAGLSFANDTIKPKGEIPIALMEMEANNDNTRDGSDDTKTTLDLILGMSQVINNKSLFQLNYSISQANGYLTDPYDMVTIVDDTTGNILTNGGLTRTIYENRPDSRLKQSIYGLYKTSIFDKDVFEVSYRFMTDDWGINSHTLETRYRKRLGSNSFVRPHLRLYQQSEADFFKGFVKEADLANYTNKKSDYISADYRLAKMNAYTIGLEYGRDNVKHPWSFAVEYYMQTIDEPDNKFGSLADSDLYEDRDAIMLRLLFEI